MFKANITTNEEARAYVEALIEQAGGYEAYAKKAGASTAELFQSVSLRKAEGVAPKVPGQVCGHRAGRRAGGGRHSVRRLSGVASAKKASPLTARQS